MKRTSAVLGAILAGMLFTPNDSMLGFFGTPKGRGKGGRGGKIKTRRHPVKRLSSDAEAKIEKERKTKRRISNKSRKINQKRARHNQFTK